MSLVPYLVNELLNEPYYRYGGYSPINRLYDQHYGGGLLNDDLFTNRPALYNYLVPRIQFEDTGATVSNEKNQFKVGIGCTL